MQLLKQACFDGCLRNRNAVLVHRRDATPTSSNAIGEPGRSCRNAVVVHRIDATWHTSSVTQKSTRVAM